MKTTKAKTGTGHNPAAGQREYMVRHLLTGKAVEKVAKMAAKRRGDDGFPFAKLKMLAAGYKSDIAFFRRMFAAA